MQIGGKHYEDMGEYEPWKVMEKWGTKEEFLGYLKLTALKYIARAGKKGDALEDMKKAKHFLDKFIQTCEAL